MEIKMRYKKYISVIAQHPVCNITPLVQYIINALYNVHVILHNL